MKTGNTLKLTIGGVTYTMIPTIPDNENGNGGGDDPIASELWGLWVDKDIPEIFTIEFGKDTIIFGGTAGQNYKQYDALIDMGYTWRAGNGKIELVYKNIPQGVFTYTISGNELRLKASPVIVDVGVFVKQ